MIISFINKDIREICEDGELCMKEYGEDVEQTLFSLLSDLEAADTLSEVIVGSHSEVIYNGENCYKIELSNLHIILANNHVKKKDELKWEDVRRVKILKIQKNEF